MEDTFVIKGLAGKSTLNGIIPVRGAKNAVLKILAASFLFDDEVIVENIPKIEDVGMMEGLLNSLGSTISKKGDSCTVKAPQETHGNFSGEISKQLRASIVVTGPVLSRYGKVIFPHPGGCILGARPIDLFIDGYKKMGATIEMKDGYYEITAQGGKLHGVTLFFKQQSVGATETFMMAGVLAEGKTTLKNCACEPEIKHLAEYLSSCGAKIKGAGTHTIHITGTQLLTSKGKSYVTLPDRQETGSFLILGALSAQDLLITECNPEHVEALIEILHLAGVEMEIGEDTIRVKAPDSYNPVDIKTHEYPGFPTDLQAPMAVLLTQASGQSLIFETIFEARLEYVKELVHMGADIAVCDPHRAIVNGPTPLYGKRLMSPDIRAGLAFILAAIIADGESVIHNICKIDRGYEKIENRLKDIGINIKRVS